MNTTVYNAIILVELNQDLFLFRCDEDFDITPSSSQLLFYPSTQHVTITGKNILYFVFFVLYSSGEVKGLFLLLKGDTVEVTHIYLHQFNSL